MPPQRSSTLWRIPHRALKRTKGRLRSGPLASSSARNATRSCCSVAAARRRSTIAGSRPAGSYVANAQPRLPASSIRTTTRCCSRRCRAESTRGYVCTPARRFARVTIRTFSSYAARVLNAKFAGGGDLWGAGVRAALLVARASRHDIFIVSFRRLWRRSRGFPWRVRRSICRGCRTSPGRGQRWRAAPTSSRSPARGCRRSRAGRG